MAKHSNRNRRRMRQAGIGGGMSLVRRVPVAVQRSLPNAPTLSGEADYRLRCLEQATRTSVAEDFGQQALVGAMERALEEGRAYDERLTELAESEITPELQSMGEEGEEEGDEAEALAASLGGAQTRAKGRRSHSTGQRAR